MFCGLANAQQAYAFCGGFDLGDHGQGAQCLSDDDGPNGCYNAYGVANSCWSSAPMSACCNHGSCRGDYDPYTQHCTCDGGWTGARCDTPSSPPPSPPPPPPPLLPPPPAPPSPPSPHADGYGSGEASCVDDPTWRFDGLDCQSFVGAAGPGVENCEATWATGVNGNKLEQLAADACCQSCSHVPPGPPPPPPSHTAVAVDCVGGWGACNHACTRAFEIHTRPSNGGRACILAEGTVDTTGCQRGDGQCLGGTAPVPPTPPPGSPSRAGDHVIGVICGSGLEQQACFQQFLGKDGQDASDQPNQEVSRRTPNIVRGHMRSDQPCIDATACGTVLRHRRAHLYISIPRDSDGCVSSDVGRVRDAFP